MHRKGTKARKRNKLVIEYANAFGEQDPKKHCAFG